MGLSHGIILPPKTLHPKGETEISLKQREIAALVTDTFDGKLHIEWDPPVSTGHAAGSVAVLQHSMVTGAFISLL